MLSATAAKRDSITLFYRRRESARCVIKIRVVSHFCEMILESFSVSSILKARALSTLSRIVRERNEALALQRFRSSSSRETVISDLLALKYSPTREKGREREEQRERERERERESDHISRYTYNRINESAVGGSSNKGKREEMERKKQEKGSS